MSLTRRLIQGGCFFALNKLRFRNRMPTNGCEPQVVAFKPLHRPGHTEAILDINPRTAVQEKYVENFERYSGIVRVTARFLDAQGRESTNSGSGIVIDEQHVLTVGHIIWPEKKPGPPVSISVERDSRVDPGGLDRRYVEAVAVHFQWARASSEQNDFAVLRVSHPFYNTKPMEVHTTPTTAEYLNVEICGFSGDMPLGHLYSSWSWVRYLPAVGPLLDHYGDTEEGASGGPVVYEGRAIALHRGWDYVKAHVRVKCNRAVIINHHGNDVQKFINAIAVVVGDTPLEGFQLMQPSKFNLNGSVMDCFGW